MNTDRFYIVEIADKFSRMVMLLFAGIILCTVLLLAYYIAFDAKIGAAVSVIMVFIALYCSYISITNYKRQNVNVRIFKDKIEISKETKSSYSTTESINYSDISEYKISPLTDKDNAKLVVPDKDKFSLRIYGFKTTITTKDGNKTTFEDNKKDGILIYSPAYVYRMIDLKRYVKDFPLVLENFETKKDYENFKKQFEYYMENERNLPVYKNGSYLLSLLKYTVCFIVLAFAISYLVVCFMNLDFSDMQTISLFIQLAVGIFIIVMFPSYIIAILSSIFGGLVNRRARFAIKSVLVD